MVEERGIEDDEEADEIDSVDTVVNALRRAIERGTVKNHSSKFKRNVQIYSIMANLEIKEIFFVSYTPPVKVT